MKSEDSGNRGRAAHGIPETGADSGRGHVPGAWDAWSVQRLASRASRLAPRV